MRGGRRVGAGRPKKPKPAALSWPPHEPTMLPVAYMLAVMRNPECDAKRRDRMAEAAAPYFHQKLAAKDPLQMDLPLEDVKKPAEAAAPATAFDKWMQ